jgi:hypothetical protein
MHQKNDVVCKPLCLAYVVRHEDHFDAAPLRIEQEPFNEER